ncbi:polypeptide N-acetylgalactosaminyltransferase 13-like [Mercenaria mercenaria]|uniref:polypeptide N-acetylgalactosaminyltransferase 13-like n=1 Tax=Mercenaria mercenaria TaxID=6596 RepID=UPI00234E7EF2|nr:polypeptide N-acetylgalactosaminyltransferase 13-like [Mercenaria mercenaria]
MDTAYAHIHFLNFFIYEGSVGLSNNDKSSVSFWNSYQQEIYGRQTQRQALTQTLVFFSYRWKLISRVHEEGFDESELVDKVKLGLHANVSERKHRFITRNETIRTFTPKEKTVIYRQYGPGANGTGVNTYGLNLSLPGLEERNKFHGFNTFISDMIGLHRKLPDMRPSECKHKVYPDNLPPITVVIIFRDEWYSILLRTVYSVLETSPPHLIYEIILVDDGSTNDDLISCIKMHVQNVDKLTLVQNERPLGLMMARQTGINAVRSELFAVMDGHMEVGPGWLEPLIYRLVQNPKALLCSHVGWVNEENFEFVIDNNRPEEKNFDTFFPFFDHVNLDQMFAEYSPAFKEKRNHSVEPIPFGTLQGMMMVMRKDFFMQLGGFDPGMRVWGSEQMEISVKVWLCGGVVEMVPCSKVAHMFRITPWGEDDPANDYHSLNKARMVEVWMDPPYSDTIRHYLSDKNYTIENLQERRVIRTRNRCKPYQYFIDIVKSISNVYIPKKIEYRGRIQNQHNKRCIDLAKTDDQLNIILYPCHKMVTFNQYFILTEKNQIRCIEGNLFNVEKCGDEVMLKLRWSPSEYSKSDAEWDYSENRLKHVSTGLCITAFTLDKLGLRVCTGSMDQIWKWDKVK